MAQPTSNEIHTLRMSQPKFSTNSRNLHDCNASCNCRESHRGHSVRVRYKSSQSRTNFSEETHEAANCLTPFHRSNIQNLQNNLRSERLESGQELPFDSSPRLVRQESPVAARLMSSSYQLCAIREHIQHSPSTTSNSHRSYDKFDRLLPSNSLTKSNVRRISRSHNSITANLSAKILSLIILNTVLSHLNHIIQLQSSHVFAEEATYECEDSGDCPEDKICHEGKCICNRSRPVEDKEHGTCLPFAVMNGPCSMNEQCLGQSTCIDSYCSCDNNSIVLYNPSVKLDYCIPKRRLNEECINDSQCPPNAFCSSMKYGCLCQNGYGPSTVRSIDGAETLQCLPKTCSKGDECESEYHICDENRCKCLATHFDPHTALCYKFGSTGGEGKSIGNMTILHDQNDGKGFVSILKDLMENSDKLWIVIMILVVLTLLLLALMIIVLRKHYLGYCWTAHKKEYEPNNETSPRDSQFNKNSINNMSFRRKSAGLDDDGGDDSVADKSTYVTEIGKKNSRTPLVPRNESDSMNGNQYVKVDMREAEDMDGGHQHSFGRKEQPNRHNQHSNHQAQSRPLPTSLSTPV